MSNFIKNTNLPVCRQCKHCSIKPYELDVCKKFGKLNINTGKITYFKTYETRLNDDMCGKTGKYYNHDNMYIFKNTMAQVQEFLPFGGIVSVFGIYAYSHILQQK